MQDLCVDIKKLDYAKNHLQTSITSLNRLQMLTNAVSQLEVSLHLTFTGDDYYETFLGLFRDLPIGACSGLSIQRSSQPSRSGEAVYVPF